MNDRARARPFRVSAKAVVLRDGKLLALALRDAEGVYYILPGGGAEDAETMPAAVVREVREETGLDVEAGELLFAMESPCGESFHRVDLVFRCTLRGEMPETPETAKPDHGQIGVAWLDAETLPETPLYPSRLRAPICWLARGEIDLARWLGAESVGDSPVRADCPCTTTRCPRHGDCAACAEYHLTRAKSGVTACGKDLRR